MLANWMLYCVAVGTLLAGGALALERGLRALARPTRWAWSAAMALALAIPAAVRLAPAPRAEPVAAPAAPSAPRLRTPAPPATKTRVSPLAIAPVLELGGWDPALRAAWGASSTVVLLALGAMGIVLARRRRAWRAAEVDGVPVLVSHDTGPAVVGLLRSRIVLPAWALAADEEARRLVLEHEREHVRAGDPRLVAAALLAVILIPWNPAAWWMLRRLRLAIEVDCDARVLRRRADVRAYGTALLEIGRRTVRSPLPVAAFAEPVSSLERRIRIMTAPRARRPLLRASGFAAVAATLAALACEAPQPTQPPAQEPTVAKTALTPDPPGVLQLADVDEQPEIVNPAAVRRLLQESYPPLLREAGVEGLVTVSMVVGADGLTRLPAVVHADHEAFSEPALAAVAGMRFQPAKKDGRAVAVRVSLPIAFQLSRSAAGPASADASGSEHEAALRDAVRRHYPPLMRDAGITAQVAVSFTVAADGKAQGVQVVGDRVQPAFAEAARAVVADLTFPRTAPAEEMVMTIVFAPERTPAPES